MDKTNKYSNHFLGLQILIHQRSFGVFAASQLFNFLNKRLSCDLNLYWPTSCDPDCGVVCEVLGLQIHAELDCSLSM